MHHSFAAPSRPTAYLVPADATLGTRNKHAKSTHEVLLITPAGLPTASNDAVP